MFYNIWNFEGSSYRSMAFGNGLHILKVWEPQTSKYSLADPPASNRFTLKVYSFKNIWHTLGHLSGSVSWASDFWLQLRSWSQGHEIEPHICWRFSPCTLSPQNKNTCIWHTLKEHVPRCPSGSVGYASNSWFWLRVIISVCELEPCIRLCTASAV